jgi:hypothetical protein
MLNRPAYHLERALSPNIRLSLRVELIESRDCVHPHDCRCKDVNYGAATSQKECQDLPNGKWDDQTKTCSKGE